MEHVVALDQLLVREMINACLATLTMGLVIIFGIYLSSEIFREGWYSKIENRAAVGLMVYFMGVTIQRSWTVALLWSARTGYDTAIVVAAFPMAIMGFSIAIVGGLCCIRIFSKPEWDNWPWFYTFLACCTAAAITYVLN